MGEIRQHQQILQSLDQTEPGVCMRVCVSDFSIYVFLGTEADEMERERQAAGSAARRQRSRSPLSATRAPPPSASEGSEFVTPSSTTPVAEVSMAMSTSELRSRLNQLNLTTERRAVLRDGKHRDTYPKYVPGQKRSRFPFEKPLREKKPKKVSTQFYAVT